MRRVIGVLRAYLLLILGFLALLAMTVIFWSIPSWPLAVMAVLERHLLFIGILGGGLASLVLFWRLPKWQAARPELTPQERFTAENEARKTLAQIVGGAAVLASLYFTWGALEVSREGQITDRFTKAIAQLGEQGPEKLAVRLGGIYALERIARDSKRDDWPIMEVLTAYVREHAPRPPEPIKDEQPLKSTQSPQEKPTAMPIATDIQAILTVLGRRTHTYRNGEEQRLDLAGTDLHGARLQEAHLEGARLENARLEGAYLRAAHLQGANLEYAHLEGAINLTAEQLATVKTLYPGYLDPPLREQIEQRYPHLLEKPQG